MNVVPMGNGAKPIECCVISLATGRSTYLSCLQRLEKSLRRVRFDGDFLSWADELPEGSPTHFEAPMAFKTFCFREARRQGYRLVLWIDAPIVALRSLQPIFNLIRQKGFITFTNNYGQSLGQWSSDEVLAHHGISREDAMQIPETPTSVIGLDLESELGNEFLSQWHKTCNDGLTCRGRIRPYSSVEEYYAVAWNKEQCISKDPRVGGHRHDQTAAGIVAHRLGMKPYADHLRDIHYEATPIQANTSLLHHREFGNQITSLDDIYYRIFVYRPFIERPLFYVRKVMRTTRNLLIPNQASVQHDDQ